MNLKNKAMMELFCLHLHDKGEYRGDGLHFDEKTAKCAVSKIHYTDKAGKECHGAHWTSEQIESVTEGMEFPEGTTAWDRYVAYNSLFADLCKVLDEASVLKCAYAFYFADEDAPQGKIKRYIDCLRHGDA